METIVNRRFASVRQGTVIVEADESPAHRSGAASHGVFPRTMLDAPARPDVVILNVRVICLFVCMADKPDSIPYGFITLRNALRACN